MLGWRRDEALLMCRTDAAVEPSAAETERLSPADARRNHRLGVAAGALGGLGRGFLEPDIIIAGFIDVLTQSPGLVSLVAVVNKGGLLGAQFFAGSRLEHHVRKMPFFALLIAIRAAGMAGLIASIAWLGGDVSAAAITAFFAAYLLVSMCGGSGHILFIDMLGRMIPSRRLGAFLGSRQFLGNLLPLLAGFWVIQPILTGVDLPWNYLLLAAIGATATTMDMLLITRCREQPLSRQRRRTTLRRSLRRGVLWLRRDRSYRMFFWSRVAFRINYLGLAFMVPYGRVEIGRGRGTSFALLGGILVGTSQLSRVAASALWGRVADRRGYRACLLAAGGCFVVAPMLALLAPRLPRMFELALPGVPLGVDLPLATYMLALVLLGVGRQGNILGGQLFLVTSAPANRRPSYVSFLSMLTSPLTLLPLLGAYLVSLYGMEVVFLLPVGGGVLSVASAWRMASPPLRRAAKG